MSISKSMRKLGIAVLISILFFCGCGDKSNTEHFEYALFGTGTAISNDPSYPLYEVEPNDDFNSAQAITNSVTGNKDSSDSKDIFKIVATGSSMTLNLYHGTTYSSTSDFEVTVYNSSPEEMDYFNAYNGIDAGRTIGVISGQTYFIKVYVYGAGSTDQYQLTVTFGNEAYEVEPNGDFVTAQTITPDVTYTGQKNGGDNSDFFKVTATTGSSMTVSLAHVTQNSTTSDFKVTIYGSNQAEIASFDAYNGVNGSIIVNVYSGGDFYVKVYVYGADSYDDKYRLKVSF